MENTSGNTAEKGDLENIRKIKEIISKIPGQNKRESIFGTKHKTTKVLNFKP